MQCSAVPHTGHSTLRTTVQASICGVISIRIRINFGEAATYPISHGIDLHTQRYVRTLSTTHSPMLFVCVLFSCYAIAMPCIASSLSFYAMPCPAMPCHALSCPPCYAVPPAWSRPSSQSSIDISAVSYPAFPTIGSQTRLHFGFRTSPTKRPVPSLALTCAAKVGAQPANLPISACLPACLRASRSRLLV